MLTPPHTQLIPVSRLVNSRQIRLIFTDPKLRPPVLSEMQPDINRLAASIARIRSDQTSYALGQEDLIAECSLKLAQLITKGKLEKVPNRYEAFKYIKTVFNNHVKSLVSRHRMTLKRGARRATSSETGEPSEFSLNDNTATFNTIKNVEMSSDDPDQHVQIADPTSAWSPESNFINDIAVYLTPVELAVLKEFSEPSDRTRFYAEYDSVVGRRPGSSKHTITFSEKNHADGLGLELPHFKKILKSLREKLTWIKMNDADTNEIKWNMAITRLEEVFDLQIPKSIEKTIVRRLLTIAAVDQFDKVEILPQVRADLQYVGAKVPEKRAGVLACFGIMYQNNNRTCIACGLKSACKDDANNFGLGDITLDSRLLGSKQFRIPVVVSNNPEPADILSPRDEEIYNYLRGNFNAQLGTNEMVFKHKETGKVVVIVKLTPQFEIKIHNPSVSLAVNLAKDGASYYVPGALSAVDAIHFIAEHAHEAFISAN